MVVTFREVTPENRMSAGGKGRTLARLQQAGYPVPDGLVILPEAFDADRLRPAAWIQVQSRLPGLREGKASVTFAVRSSALAEDSARASFAGEYESLLDVAEADLPSAIERVRCSRHAARAAAYSSAHGLDGQHEMAVVVQRYVPADFAGVLFTANPVTGSRMHMAGNFVAGSGDKLMSGEANPLTFRLEGAGGRYHGPAEMRAVAPRLHSLARRLAAELGGPQDIEWAVAGGQVACLQARPITTPQPHDPATGEWNDTLLGDCLWSNANFSEAMPAVMTPITWSMMQTFFQVNAIGFESVLPLGGNIGGRLYVNLSVMLSATDALHVSRRWVVRAAEEMFGRLPEGIRVPTAPFSARWVLGEFIPQTLRRMRQVAALKKRVPAFVAETPARVKALRAQIEAAATPADLLALWQSTLKQHLAETMRMLAAGTSDYKNLSRDVHIELAKLIGESDANALMAGATQVSERLASLGPVVGLARMARGEMARADYLQNYGHRGPYELELSRARPEDDPEWLDRQLAEASANPVDVTALLDAQRARHAEAWARFAARYPGRAKAMRRKLDRLAASSQAREATRSEVVRMMGVFRSYALRAGVLTGLQDGIFFLSLEEVAALLGGDCSAVAFIEARRDTHERYSALPPYPAFIVGRFDPIQWAADPDRRNDWFDSEARAGEAIVRPEATIRGFAGASGVVEGIVRLLGLPEEGHLLEAGEVLVTTMTNIGWTPLFPRAAAIVTDVGAPLSHAAIVARELGVPAVVGTGDATMRLKTGDRVRVDGGRGIVELLQPA